MGRVPNIEPLILEMLTKQAEPRAEEREFALVLARLEALEVCEATKAIFQRYISGELTIKELDTAIDVYLRLKAK